MVPVRVWLRGYADFVEATYFSRSEFPLGSREVIPKLRFVPGSDEHGADAWLAHYPVQSHLRGRDFARLSDIEQYVHDPIETIFIDRAGRIKSGQPGFGRARISAKLAS